MTDNTALAERQEESVSRRPVAVIREAIESRDVSAGVSRTAFVPATMGEAMEVAKLMAAGNFVPGHLRGKPGDCLAVVMQAARWAMDPFAVGNKTYFVNDRMAYEAQLVAAVVNSSNLLQGRLNVDWKGSGNELECFVTGKIKGDPNVKTRHVKIASITTRNSPLWKQDPEQQIGYYTQRAWARLHCPEVLLGVYTPDEIASMDVDGGELQTEPRPVRQRLSSAMLAEQAGATVEHDADGVITDAETVEHEPEGPADEQMGEAHSDAIPAWMADERHIRDLLDTAQTARDVKDASAELDLVRVTIPDLQLEALDALIAKKRAQFQAA